MYIYIYIIVICSCIRCYSCNSRTDPRCINPLYSQHAYPIVPTECTPDSVQTTSNNINQLLGVNTSPFDQYNNRQYGNNQYNQQQYQHNNPNQHQYNNNQFGGGYGQQPYNRDNYGGAQYGRDNYARDNYAGNYGNNQYMDPYYYQCKKVDMYVNNELVTVRGCAPPRSGGADPCYDRQRGSYSYGTYVNYCGTCAGEACNSAHNVRGMSTALVLVPLMALIRTYVL